MKSEFYTLTVGLLALVHTLSPVAGHAETVDSDRPDYRLSGTVVLSPTRTLALIENEDGEGEFYRVGDKVEGWGRVTMVEPDHVRLQTPEGEVVVRITGIETPVPVAVATGTADQHSANDAAAGHRTSDTQDEPAKGPRIATLNADLATELKSMSKRDFLSATDLENALLPLSDIPATATIEAINGQPIDDAGGLEALRMALATDSPIRLTIAGMDGMDSLYILPEAGDVATTGQE